MTATAFAQQLMKWRYCAPIGACPATRDISATIPEGPASAGRESRQYLFGVLGAKEASHVFTDDHSSNPNSEVRCDLIFVVVLVLVHVVLRFFGFRWQLLPCITSINFDVLLVLLPIIVAGRSSWSGCIDRIGVLVRIMFRHAGGALRAHWDVSCPVRYSNIRTRF